MKKKVYSFVLSLVAALAAVPAWGQDATGGTVTQPRFGKQTVTVQTGQELTFYDPKGTAGIESNAANNTQSLTVFKPAEKGMAVQVTFDKTDVTSDYGGYYGRVYVYNGDPDAGNTFKWASSITEVTSSSTMPEGDVIEVLDGKYTAKTYYSTADDGSLSVGMLWRYAAACEGWTARVSCIKLEDMKVSGAGSSYAAVIPSPTGKAAVALASVYVTAEGVLNADRLTSITFTMARNEGMIDPLSVKVYEGELASCSGATPIEASVEATGGSYRITLDRPLQGGRNALTLAADINPEAEVGAKAELDVTAVATAAMPGGVAGFVRATPVAVANPAILLMAEGQAKANVGETPLAFYDDGGPEGKVTAKFQGTMTLLPTVEGKKVQVDFSRVKLSEGTIYYQYLNVYNGATADPTQLIRRVKSGEKATIHSTSADGALTVELGNNGTSYTADGFEATVSLFTPQPMTADNIAVSQASGQTVCAGDTGQPLLRVNIHTSNTEPPLKAGTFAFNANGTHATIKAAALYYTGADEAFSTKNEVGRTEVTADAFSIKPADGVTLKEGDNYFWLACDVADDATNGQAADAALATVELNGRAEAVAEGNPEGDRKVENIVYSHAGQGTVTKAVNGSLELRTKPRSEYSENYEAGDDVRTNVFVPMHEGNVCQIGFSAFDLYYASASYGVKADFRVYSGQGTKGELLWKLDNPDDKQKGPGRALRSTAADGSLTVVFSPTDGTLYYTATGFKATVSEYKSQPMDIDKVEVTQTTTDIMPSGATAQALLTINVVAKGDQQAKALEAVTIDTKGCGAAIAKASLYYVGHADANPAPDAAPAGSAQPATGSETMVIRLDEPVQLAEGNNFFRLCIDLGDAAKAGDNIDAAVTAVTAGGKQTEVAAGDPDGSRTVKDMLLLQQGDNGEVKLKAATNLMVYDDGGENEPASMKFDGKVTFAPAVQGESVKLKVKAADLNCTDTLYVYAGSTTDKDSLMLAMQCYDKLPADIVSTAPSGKLTVRYVVRSGYSAPDGFAIEAVSYMRKALGVASVNTAIIAPEAVTRGQDDVLMMRVDVDVEGDYGQVDINSMALGATGAEALSQVTVYTTDTIGNFAPFTVFGRAQAAPFDVTGNYTITAAGTYRFWVAAAIAAEAATGTPVSMTLDNVATSLGQNRPATGLTATTAVRDGASGTLTVGQGRQYPTIQAAVDAIAGGIEGPVNISIARGIYNEVVRVPYIPGTSERNTVTIQSETGNYNDVKLYHNQYSDPGYSDDKMNREYGVLTIDGADYVTVRGIEMTTTDLTYPGIAFVKGASRHVTIDSCYIHAETTTTYSQNINLVYTYARDEANCNNDYLTVANCLLEGGYIGVRMGGTSTVRLPKERGGVIEGNTLRNQGSKAIYAMDELGAKIRRNRIENTVSTASGFQGFDGQLRDAHPESMVIEGNIFDLATPGGAIAINPRKLTGTPEAPVIIANNEIKVKGNNASSAGIKLGSAGEHVIVAHNTVLATGTNVGAALWINATMTADVTVANNILQNHTKGYAYRLYNADAAKNIAFRSNAAFTSGKVFAYNRADIATPDGWQELSGETGGVADSVAFLSDVILEPAAGGNLLTAVPLQAVTTDINGKPRAQQPTIGAYEYNAQDAAPAMAEGYPAVAATTDTSAIIAVKTDIAATVYITVRPESAPAPTPAEMTADGCTELTLYAGREAAASTDTLTTGSRYVAYAMAVSLRGTAGNVVAGKPFVATGEAIVEAPNTGVVAEGCTVEAGTEATLTAYVTDGTAPFTLTWTNGRHEQIATTTLDEIDVATVGYTPSECDLYYVTVTDANGKQASDTCRVIVTGKAVAATMDNLWLAAESAWTGPDTKGEEVTGTYFDRQMAGSFVSGSYAFSNNYSLDYGSWSGFAYSNRTSTSFKTLDDQYNSAVGSGHDGSANYAVAYGNGTISVLNNAEGDTIRGMYITNNAYAVSSIVNGDSYAKPFTDGSYLKVLLTGTHADGSVVTVEHYLADYTQASAADHYYLDTWQWVDLRSLGRVVKVDFTIDGSDKSGGYLNTPAYFCLDDLNGERKVTRSATQAERSVDASPFFSFSANEGTIAYALPDAPYDSKYDGVTLTADGRLSLPDGAEGRTEIVVSATQRGKTEFVCIPFDIASAIGGPAAPATTTESRHDLGGRRTGKATKGIVIIRTTDGQVRKEVAR